MVNEVLLLARPPSPLPRYLARHGLHMGLLSLSADFTRQNGGAAMSPGAKIATLIIADLNDRKGMHINSLDEDVQSEILHIWTKIGDRIVGKAVTERLHAYDAQQANVEAINAELVKALECIIERFDNYIVDHHEIDNARAVLAKARGA